MILHYGTLIAQFHNWKSVSILPAQAMSPAPRAARASTGPAWASPSLESFGRNSSGQRSLYSTVLLYRPKSEFPVAQVSKWAFAFLCLLTFVETKLPMKDLRCLQQQLWWIDDLLDIAGSTDPQKLTSFRE